MTEYCKFSMTIPAEKIDIDYRVCPKPANRILSGIHNDRLIALDLCEEHYKIVQEWRKKEE